MGKEYKIKWNKPKDYEPNEIFPKLPSPISRPEMLEIYNYSTVDDDGFYFLDNLVDQETAGHAMKLFIDEALAHSNSVTIEEL